MKLKGVAGRRLGAASVALAALLLAACGQSAAPLEWCAANADEVGRSAVELGLFGNELTFTDWKESSPYEYERACIHAFENTSTQ